MRWILLTAAILGGCSADDELLRSAIVPPLSCQTHSTSDDVEGELSRVPGVATTCSGSSDTATSPLEFGACELARATKELGLALTLHIATVDDGLAQRALAETGVVLAERPESFAIVPICAGALVVGRDPTGAMYGAFDLAERLRLDGARAARDPATGAPAIRVRAANPFLDLPAPGEAAWWFLDERFWREYLDLLAHARMNLLDIHGMFSLESTGFPNALLYFATSATYPQVGVPAGERERNLAMLNTIIRMASARGIQVNLMSYQADTNVPGAPPSTLDDAAISVYTREAATDLASRANGLARLGFRIGESGRSAAWYVSTFVEGVRAANNGVGVSTRTWHATRDDILAIGGAANGKIMVQAKYNGEHMAAPYAIAGGPWAGWGPYSYQDFLDPPSPYSFVFQLRAGGTHRIFRFASYERSLRTAASISMSPRVDGFTYEAAHAYFPQHDFYHADAADRFSEWTFRRDELSYLMMGRLAYDPSTPQRAFRAALAKRVGTDGLWDALQAGSEIVPWVQMAHTCGPDHRDFAPELELGGDVGYWATERGSAPVRNSCPRADHGPFDSFALASPFEAAADLVAGRVTSRLSPVEVAQKVMDAASRARAAGTVNIDVTNAEARDVVRESVAIADLGDYFAHKLRAATALAVYAASGVPEWLDAARRESNTAAAAWQELATHTAYIKPFDERLRMATLGLSPFHWRDELPRLADDAASIDAVEAAVKSSPPDFRGTLPEPSAWLGKTRAVGPGLAALDVSPADAAAPRWTITASFDRALPERATVNLLFKPFASEHDWRSVPMTLSDGKFVASVAGTGKGALFAVEVGGAIAEGWRYPDVLHETPYRGLAP